MKTIKIFLSIIILTVFFCTINAVNINLDINENIQAKELGQGQIEVITQGEIKIENPSNTSLIYEYEFKFKDNINFQIKLNSNNNSNLTYTNKKIKGKELNPKEIKIINYEIKGIIPKTQYNEFYNSKITLFEWYLENKKFNPLRYATLNKLDKLTNYRSDETFERLIVIEGKNPSEFNVEIVYMNLFKTKSNENFSQILNSQDLLETYQNINLNPNQTFNFQTKDENSNDKTTYWIEYNIIAKTNLTSKFILNYYTYSSGSSSSKDTSKDTNENTIIEKSLLFTKNSDKYILDFKDNLTISLIIQNPNDFKISNLLIIDEYNENFELINIENQENLNPHIQNDKLNILINQILPFETKIINYNLKFTKNTTENLLYFPPSKLSYKNQNIYSNSLNIINNIDTNNKRLLIQKEIEYLDFETNRIHIKIKNIGEIDFTNLTIIESEGEIKIETKYDAIQQNKWKIPSLKVGEEWTTYYDINNENINKYIPEIYGADNAKIYKTLILNQKIETYPIKDNPKTYQKIIVGIAILLLITDIVF